MEAKDPIQNAFKAWRIWLAIFLGLGISFWMLVSNLQTDHFVKADVGTGTHFWLDSNHNGKQEVSEFELGGIQNYKKQQASDLIKSLDWSFQAVGFLFLAILCMIGRDLAYCWRILTLSKNTLSKKAAFYTIMLWEFASALSPGVVGGSAVAMFILEREKVPLGRASAMVIITAFMDNLFFVLLIPVIFFLGFSGGIVSESFGITSIFWFGYGIICTICLLLISSLFVYPSLITLILKWIFKLSILKKWKQKALRTGNEIELSSIEFKSEKPFFWFKVFASTVLSWTSRYLVINFILAAFISLSFGEHLFVLAKQVVLWLFMLISPTPGASGVAEYAFGELMRDFSENALLITALAILWRLISYFPYLIIGAIILPRWLRRK